MKEGICVAQEMCSKSLIKLYASMHQKCTKILSVFFYYIIHIIPALVEHQGHFY